MTLKEKTNFLLNQELELTKDTCKWLSNNLTKQSLVFEWGVSSATFWLAKQVRTVYTHEHSERFYYLSKETIAYERFGNIQIHLVPQDKSIDKDFIASNNKSYKSFIESIEYYPSKIFDLICIKEKCVFKALELATSNAKDNSIILFCNGVNNKLLEDKEFKYIKTFKENNLTNTIVVV